MASRALGLLSGGLDSSLAAMVLKRQGVDVTCICFVTPFFGATKAQKAAKQMEIPLIVQDIGDVHLDMVKNPKYGYGKNMNPCIDCHAMMFRLAGETMAEGDYDFLFSGEVLGQRPMSQNANALRSVANYSGYPDRILRPLSAKILPITPVEEQGLVDREQLLDIQGRSRKRQEALAKEWGITDYPSSGGGCLLTEPGFSVRLRDLVDADPDCTCTDVELLKVGRQFRLAGHAKLVVGRNQADNERMLELASPDAMRLRCTDFSGPTGVLCGDPGDVEIQQAAAIVASYGKGKDEAEVEVLLRQGEKEETLVVAPMARDESQKMLL